MAVGIEPFYLELGQRIREFRTKLRMTQEQLGQSLIPSTTRVSIANVESGKQRILSHTLVQFAEALNVEPGDLLPPKKKALSPADRDIADVLVSEAGLSKTIAKKLLESPETIKTWKEAKS
jgi:transcriptional regulator with XRE-family HTH domain